MFFWAIALLQARVRERRNIGRDRAPPGFVVVEQCRRAAFRDRRELPAQNVRILDTCVHPLPAGERMCRWANKDELVLAAFEHYRASHPVELLDAGSLRVDLLAALTGMGGTRATVTIVAAAAGSLGYWLTPA